MACHPRKGAAITQYRPSLNLKTPKWEDRFLCDIWLCITWSNHREQRDMIRVKIMSGFNILSANNLHR